MTLSVGMRYSSCVEEKTFLLHFEGEELDETLGGNEIQHLGMWEGCELLLCCNVWHNTMCVLSQELSSEDTRKAMGRRLEEDPDLLLQVDTSGVGNDMHLYISQYSLHKNLRHLKVTDPGQCVTHIRDGFLRECTSLVTVDLTSLQSVREVGNNFMTRCTALQSVDLTPFHRVTSVGRPKTYRNSLLCECESLTEVDLSPLRNVDTITDYFLSGCKSLKVVDLSPLRNVKTIGVYFLAYCSSLERVDLSPLSKLTTLNGGFMTGCTSLRTLNVNPLRNVTIIDHDFLAHNDSLTSVELGRLRLKCAGWKFLAHCPSLTSVDLTNLRKCVTMVGCHFMEGCDSIPEEDRSTPQENCGCAVS
eukprot:TRINITY_DN867_c0_g1_i27.p1 TRINITY_DN867_c0_g1~~TRINITY_DN867_c0_g1_i27.p1  ORF type:complete len:360 (+),score=49.58 TRINITY_DN867_c0_g1_i27:126-1205(+)